MYAPVLLTCTFFTTLQTKAECIDASGIVDCTETDNDGFGSASIVNRLQVEQNAVINDTGNGGNGAAGFGGGVVYFSTFDGSFVNFGQIIDQGSANDGVLVNGNFSGSFQNAGTINGGNYGVVFYDYFDGSFVNTDTINGFGSDGVYFEAIAQTEFRNSGNIFGQASGVRFADDSPINFTNLGSIVGATESAVEFEDDLLGDFINSGTLDGHDTGLLLWFGLSGSITNSGTIKGGNYAIREFNNRDTTLNLMAGSNLQGRIDLGGGNNVINIGSGLSISNTFEGGVPSVGTTSGSPYAVSGNQLVVIDPVMFAMQDDYVTELARGISRTVTPAIFDDGGSVGYSQDGEYGFVDQQVDDTELSASSRRYWAGAFGASGQRDHDHLPTAGLGVAASVFGMNERLADDAHFGLYFGGHTGVIETSNDNQDAEIDGLFGGFSWGRKTEAGTYWHVRYGWLDKYGATT